MIWGKQPPWGNCEYLFAKTADNWESCYRAWVKVNDVWELVYGPSYPQPTGNLLLLHCDGSQGSTSFPDSSPTGRTTTPVYAIVDTAAPKFGTGCMKCGTGTISYTALTPGVDYNTTPTGSPLLTVTMLTDQTANIKPGMSIFTDRAYTTSMAYFEVGTITASTMTLIPGIYGEGLPNPISALGYAPTHCVDVDQSITLGDTFCVEMWVKFNSLGNNYNGYHADRFHTPFEFGKYHGSTNHLTLQLYYLTADATTYCYVWYSIAGVGSGSWDQLILNSALPLDTWRHIALTANAGFLRFFYNGAMTTLGSLAGPLPPLRLRLGADRYLGGAMYLDGFMDEVRVTVGDPVYTDTFTPPSGPF